MFINTSLSQCDKAVPQRNRSCIDPSSIPLPKQNIQFLFRLLCSAVGDGSFHAISASSCKKSWKGHFAFLLNSQQLTPFIANRERKKPLQENFYYSLSRNTSISLILTISFFPTQGAEPPSCLTPMKLAGKFFNQLSQDDFRCTAPVFNNIDAVFNEEQGRLRCTATGINNTKLSLFLSTHNGALPGNLEVLRCAFYPLEKRIFAMHLSLQEHPCTKL